jgi:hypothetical protein
MTKLSGTPVTYRFVADALLGLGFFVLVLVAIVGTAQFAHWASSAAHAGGIIQVVQQPKIEAKPELVMAAAERIEPSKASAEAGKLLPVMILSGVFALMFAFNLAFFRHIRQAYRAPRTGLGPYARWSGTRHDS